MGCNLTYYNYAYSARSFDLDQCSFWKEQQDTVSIPNSSSIPLLQNKGQGQRAAFVIPLTSLTPAHSQLMGTHVLGVKFAGAEAPAYCILPADHAAGMPLNMNNKGATPYAFCQHIMVREGWRPGENECI